MIGVGKDQYNADLPGMIQGRVLPWVEDSNNNGYPVWTSWGAVPRSTYFLNRDGSLDTTFSLTSYDPNNPDDYNQFKNLILELRNEATLITDHTSITPSGFSLQQNYPNPFNPKTTIAYSIPQSGIVELKIYDTLGREIQTALSEFQKTGNYRFDFDASQLSNGVYFYQLKVGNRFSETKKMLYIK